MQRSVSTSTSVPRVLCAAAALLAAFACPLPVRAQETVMLPSATRPADPDQAEERTSFQTGSGWDTMIDLRADVVMSYGVSPESVAHIAQWKAQGYRVHTMTGVAWGNYQDYLYGRFDGVNHEDEAQTESSGHKISHGGDVYYMSPGENYGKFLSLGVKRALDAGADAIELEEPEFWVRAGWSPGFKREWKAYYHEDWMPPDSSPDAQYRASLLKYYLYRRALTQVFDFVRDYNKQHGTHARCYVATHSLINYASWGIVSPESSLARVGADGYIAQVWTGTARTPNVYEGRTRERTFETAFLEYGAMTNIARGTGKRVWFLNDPIEDNPDHSWRDYRANWESTLTASLLWTDTFRYEIMPWPERIFHGKYPTTDMGERKPGEEVVREPIPADYATELLTVTNALNDMNQRHTDWESGTRGVGVLVSDSMMFQRFGPTPSDPHLGSFYGLALPLVKRGMPVEPVQLENGTQKGAFGDTKVLLATFEGMKPMSADDTGALAEWVRRGGVLVFVDDDKDPYNHVRGWWNAAPNASASPRAAFFAQLGVAADTPSGTYAVGSGSLVYDAASPAALTYRADGASHIRDLTRRACDLAKLPYAEANHLLLRRGPYVIGAGLDESLPATTPAFGLLGRYLDLFDARLPYRISVDLTPGSRHLLLDLDAVKASPPAILAAACKTLGAAKLPGGGFRFYAEAPDNTTAAVRVLLDAPPQSVEIDGKPLPAESRVWDEASRTVLLRFPNAATGHWVVVR